ncbi:hypothetical protein [Paracoccus mutanolyticus]|uniref:hypothetical protein n=1 Tax=Paracoccus mutanolyticus TaxID=1499308 RepID=UPI0037C52016
MVETRAALADPVRLTELDIAFHELVAKATANRAIEAARLPIGSVLTRWWLTT